MHFRQDRLDYQEHARIQKGKMRAKSELETLQSDIKRAKKAAQQIDAVAMARDAEKHIPLGSWGRVSRTAVVMNVKKRVLKCYSAFAQSPSSRPSRRTIGGIS